MDSARRILLGSTAAAVGALLGCSLWYGTNRTLLATSPSASSAASSATSPSATPAGSTDPGAPQSPAAPAVPSGATSDAERQFQELSERLQSQLKASEDRQEAAREAIEPLKEFIARYPTVPVRDKAALSLGNMQLAIADTEGAIVSFERVATRPIDPGLQPMATLLLGKARAQAGQIAEARAAFQNLIDTHKGSQYAEAAQEALARLSILPGQRPPDFLMRDVSGRSQSPGLYRGKVLLLDFWATWCGPCLEEMPNLKRLYEQHHEQGFAIVGISLDSDQDALKNYLREEGIPWPQICDGRGSKGELVRRMGVISIPTLILIDRQGIIRHVNTRGPALEQAVGELLAAPAP